MQAFRVRPANQAEYTIIKENGEVISAVINQNHVTGDTLIVEEDGTVTNTKSITGQDAQSGGQNIDSTWKGKDQKGFHSVPDVLSSGEPEPSTVIKSTQSQLETELPGGGGGTPGGDDDE